MLDFGMIIRVSDQHCSLLYATTCVQGKSNISLVFKKGQNMKFPKKVE